MRVVRTSSRRPSKTMSSYIPRRHLQDVACVPNRHTRAQLGEAQRSPEHTNSPAALERFTADTLNPGKISRSIVEARSSREIKKANSRGLWSEKGTTTNIRSGWLTVWRRARMEGPRPTWGSRRVFQPDAAWEEPRVPYVKIGTSVLCCTSPICLTRWESRPGVVRQGARRANLGVSGVPPGDAGTLFHLFSPRDMSMPLGIVHQETARSYNAGLLYAYINYR